MLARRAPKHSTSLLSLKGRNNAGLGAASWNGPLTMTAQTTNENQRSHIGFVSSRNEQRGLPQEKTEHRIAIADLQERQLAKGIIAVVRGVVLSGPKF